MLQLNQEYRLHSCSVITAGVSRLLDQNSYRNGWCKQNPSMACWICRLALASTSWWWALWNPSAPRRARMWSSSACRRGAKRHLGWAPEKDRKHSEKTWWRHQKWTNPLKSGWTTPNKDLDHSLGWLGRSSLQGLWSTFWWRCSCGGSRLEQGTPIFQSTRWRLDKMYWTNATS